MITVRLRVAGIYYNKVLEVSTNGSMNNSAKVRDVLEEARATPLSTVGGFDFQVVGNMKAGNEKVIRIHSISHNFSGKHIFYHDTFNVGDPPDLEPDEEAKTSDKSLGVAIRKPGIYSLTSEPVSGQGDVRLVWQHYVVADNGRGERRSRTKPGEGFTDFTDEEVFDQDEVTFRLVAIQFSPGSPTHEEEHPSEDDAPDA